MQEFAIEAFLCDTMSFVHYVQPLLHTCTCTRLLQSQTVVELSFLGRTTPRPSGTNYIEFHTTVCISLTMIKVIIYYHGFVLWNTPRLVCLPHNNNFDMYRK